LSVAFLPITVMAGLAGDYYWAIASGLGRYLSYRRSGRDIEFKWWKAKRVFRWRKAKELPVGGPGSHGGLGEPPGPSLGHRRSRP
jgi:hypothetical protein